MTDPRVLLIVLGVAFAAYGMVEVQQGVKFLWHTTTHAVHKIVHPHDDVPAAPAVEDNDGQ